MPPQVQAKVEAVLAGESTELFLHGEWVIGCAATVDRISSDTWPLSQRVIGTGCGLVRQHGKHLVILTLTIYTPPSPSPFLCVYVPDNKIADAGATALAPVLDGLTGLTKLYLNGEWVIECVVTVDRISSDAWPLSGVGW